MATYLEQIDDIRFESNYLNRESYLQRQHNWDFIRTNFPSLWAKMQIDLLNSSSSIMRKLNNNKFDEVTDARMAADGTVYDSLAKRLDARNSLDLDEVDL
ncbi:UNVERIFIED_CONTAM: hypothetical protein HCY04_04535 [Limosilactobacillus fermentum]